jgi:hypothetical protein
LDAATVKVSKIMEFNKLIFEKLGLIFQKYNLHLVEQRSNYLRLQSSSVIIIISQNPLENSNTLWIGRNAANSDQVEIDNKTLRLFFKSDLRLSEVTINTFIDNLVLFFEKEAKPILNGDLVEITRLEEFDLERSHLYTEKLLKKQTLEAADKAWENKNYNEFIKLINQTNKESLPLSYQLKYKIATKGQ